MRELHHAFAYNSDIGRLYCDANAKPGRASTRRSGRLLTQEHYGSVTVAQIIERADIGRSTFYAHFETKDELLSQMCAEMFAHIFEGVNERCTTHANLETEDTRRGFSAFALPSARFAFRRMRQAYRRGRAALLHVFHAGAFHAACTAHQSARQNQPRALHFHALGRLHAGGNLVVCKRRKTPPEKVAASFLSTCSVVEK